MVGACGTHGRVDKSVQGFGGKVRRKETTGGKMGSEWILGRLAGGGGGLDSTVSGQGPVAGCCE
jgi:hypothetical protein